MRPMRGLRSSSVPGSRAPGGGFSEFMADAARTPGYTVDDLDWLRAELGVAHLELGAPSAEATFEAHDFAAERITTATGAIALVVGGRPLQFDLR
jgi:hypothetical protein